MKKKLDICYLICYDVIYKLDQHKHFKIYIVDDLLIIGADNRV
jgi:hypothetical protein